MSETEVFREPLHPGDPRFLPMADSFCCDRIVIGGGELICTRVRGHDDDHAAHASGSEMLARWARDGKP